MKHWYIILGFASLFFFSCKNDSDKNIISKYIQNAIPESWSYEPIAYSVTDSALTKVEDTQQFKELLKQIEQEDSMLIPDNHKIEEINLQIEDLKKKFSPKLIGKKILHAYMCSTDFGDSLFISEFIIDNKHNVTQGKKTSQCINTPDSLRLETTKQQLTDFLNMAVKF